MKDFVSLHTHTHNSLLDGFSTTDQYLEKAKELRQRGLGIADHGNVHDIYNFISKSKKANMLAVPGIEFYVAPINPEGAKRKSPVFYGAGGKRAPQYDVSAGGAYLHLTVWAYNNVGLQNLFKLSTYSYDTERYYQKPRIDFDLLVDHSEGLVVSTGCPSSEISTRFLLGQDEKAYEYAGRLKEVFNDRLFVEVMDHNMGIDLERTLLPKQVELSKKMGIPLLATNDCHYAHKEDHVSHEEMLCVQSGARMSDATYDEGGPRFAFTGNEYYLKSAEEMSRIFPEDMYPDALSNSVAIAEMSSDISIDFNPNLRPKPTVPEEFADEVEYYKHLINQGYKERYGNASIEVKKEAVERNKYEFEVIHSSDFIGYMLVVRDYLKYTEDNFSVRNEINEIIASAIGPGRGCFLPNNTVRTEDGYKKISEISPINSKKEQTTLLTHDGTFQKLEKVFSYDVEDEDCVEIIFKNGKTITCTSDHRIFHKDRGFIEAGYLSVGDFVVGPKWETNEKTPAHSSLPTIKNNQKDNKNETLSEEVRIILKNHLSPEELAKLIQQGRRGDNEGAFKSGKVINSLIRYDSVYELKALNIFETDSDVVSVQRCVDEIPYVYNGKQYFFTPNFKVVKQDGTKVIVELQSISSEEVRTQEKLKAAKEFYNEKGAIYEVWSEIELERYNDNSHNSYEIETIMNFKYTGKVYDLSVENVRNYTVSDITVHNSVGGSIHAYELGISQVDPIKHDLIFERFLSPGRGATYQFEYSDGTVETKIVSDKKTVMDENGNLSKKYIHQIKIGDKIVEDEETLESRTE